MSRRKKIVFEEPLVEAEAVVEPEQQDADGQARADKATAVMLNAAFPPLFPVNLGESRPISALNRARP